jgi:hypothetical protein
MEENERLKSALPQPTQDYLPAEPEPAQEDLSGFAGKLKDLEIAATRGQAPSLNIDRGTAEADMSMLPEGTVTMEINVDEADQHHGSPSAGDSVFGGLGMGDIEVAEDDENGIFGAEASPIASTEMTSLAGEKSFFEDRDGTGLDTAIIVTEGGADALTEESLRREVEQLRMRNAELEAALDKALDSGSDSEDDVPLSCAKKPISRTAMAPLPRPNNVPALVRPPFVHHSLGPAACPRAHSGLPVMLIFLAISCTAQDFSNLEQKLKEMEAAEAEAEAAEKAANGESTVLEEVSSPLLACDIL